ncbi:MAG: DUF3135 domain-containing protein [Gammaproteobacteria bacterium]
MDNKESGASHSVMTSPQINFDEWARLAKNDPEAFERRRKLLIDTTISGADPEKRQRLMRTQWKVDQMRKREKTPMAACIKISQLMWDSIHGPGGLKSMLDQLIDVESPALEKARVISMLQGNETDKKA